ncbi:MAG: DapH/DapD/GlmU-related protein [Cyclobacteriaceae bacterium]|nr:DapH/DapD/GlmU-related protein [Cytophagales bacterium]MCZ8327597.1 DapH/DapD/GlmU-related protein [Cyclobacteriaceae bacterium]
MTFIKDSFRYTNSYSYLKALKSSLIHPGLRLTIVKRLCNCTSKKFIWGIFFRIWYNKLKVKYGFQIPYTTAIGYGLFLPHYGNIVVNSRAIIGNNCNISHGVTIGQTNRGKKSGVPKIGDRVWIGANSVIVGGITIGNDVMIAPLCFVNFDIPDNAVVVGNPSRIVSYKGSSGYINNFINE